MILETEDPAALERFHAMPHVESVNGVDSQITIRGQRNDLVTEVIQCLAEHRIAVIDFRTEIPTLEDVFLRLTGHTIRD